jgi:S-adenosylmethionine hydrolase
VITDISREQFARFGKNLPFGIELFGDEITTISNNYYDVAEGEKLAFFNSAGYLEIAINKGSASALLNIKSSFVVRIRFQGL